MADGDLTSELLQQAIDLVMSDEIYNRDPIMIVSPKQYKGLKRVSEVLNISMEMAFNMIYYNQEANKIFKEEYDKHE